MVSRTMDCRRTVDHLKAGTLCQRFLLFTIWFSTFEDVVFLKVLAEQYHLPSHHKLDKLPTTGAFQPIQISPSVIPHDPIPDESNPPMYPRFPMIYKPVLTGKCPVNFSAISDVIERTALDCSQPLASYVGNVICCPQFSSLLRIFQGYHSTISDKLVFQDATADDCFSDIISILASKGANSSISRLCSVKPSNITGGSCPVKDVNSFEKIVNTSLLLDSCSTVDLLKECCRPVCQPAITDAALQLSGQLAASDGKNAAGGAINIDTLNDCRGVVFSWLSRKLSADAANTAFRIVSSCKVNKVCPLQFRHPLEVVEQCRNTAAPGPSCCSSLNSYINGVQKQMLITNKQAIICSTMFASMLQKAGVMANVYELCDVDLKDFSIQVTAYGQQGCLLRSQPADIVYDNVTGYSFTCDLNDNIGAPWPSSSSMSSFSLCAPEMSLPALPKSKHSGSHGYHRNGRELSIPIFLVFAISVILY
ncbi:uncharacterized GPI-anchored protein At1g61900-like isoform X1 [Chenopodium quinoa]|uniref:uncharacterized GPI-anchored protein At1g61900-like isoform X1 n=1 Tax=Chenopodium quinoa TaxID=63459 RepID=UPI000B795AE5|nr:uncharacterized GPI-anchored protein At1g61900-like isoform X1 [Chenopodium quinoa]